jgi:hypothetical protein
MGENMTTKEKLHKCISELSTEIKKFKEWMDNLEKEEIVLQK